MRELMEEVGVCAALVGPSTPPAGAPGPAATTTAAAAPASASLEPLFLFRFVDPAVCRVWGTAFRATLQGGQGALEFPVRGLDRFWALCRALQSCSLGSLRSPRLIAVLSCCLRCAGRGG